MRRTNRSARSELGSLIREYGRDEVERSLRELDGEDDVLTVVVNRGMHHIPSSVLRGTIFEFSKDHVVLDPENLKDSTTVLLKRAHKFLSSKKWSHVYIVPSGHPLLVVLATLVIYRTLRIDPVIVGYFGEFGYSELETDVREMIFSEDADDGRTQV